MLRLSDTLTQMDAYVRLNDQVTEQIILQSMENGEQSEGLLEVSLLICRLRFLLSTHAGQRIARKAGKERSVLRYV